MSRKVLTLAALAALTLGASTVLAGEWSRVTVRTADYGRDSHAMKVQEVHHPHHAYWGHGGPVMVYPPVHRPPVVVVPYPPAPPVACPPVYVPAPRTGFYYSDPRFSIGIGF